MTISKSVVKTIIEKLLKGENYRAEIVSLVDSEFLQYAVSFFKRVAEAKLRNTHINVDWYKNEFLDPDMPSNDIAIHSGLNRKTIHNMYGSSGKEIVIDASHDHYRRLYKVIEELIDEEQSLHLTLTIKFRGVGVDLDISESLIVINSLAVKRSALRGGFWSTTGKRVEKPLMQVLCALYAVPSDNFAVRARGKQLDAADFEREVDFYLIAGDKRYRCEVKLMGRGNPESADVVIARESKIFVADTLSDTNKRQLDSLQVEWLELRSGFGKFASILQRLLIPHRAEADMDSMARIVADILA